MTSQPSHTLFIHDCKHKHIYKSTFHVTMYKNEMKFHMLMFMNAGMMLVLMKCRCQMQCLTLGCYTNSWHWGGAGGALTRGAVPCTAIGHEVNDEVDGRGLGISRRERGRESVGKAWARAGPWKP